MNRLLPTTSLLLAAAAALPAQNAQLVGITAQIPALVSRNQGACSQNFCTPAGFPQMVGVPYQGGTGWDPIRSGAWISNGPALALVDGTCTYQCPPVPTPTPGAITGLEVVESMNELWATDTLNNLVRMTRTCPPTPISVCNLGVAPLPTRGSSGLAVDEGRQLVFVSFGDWGTGASQLRVSLMGAPCAPFHVQAIGGGCIATGFRPITGLAVDWGNSILYLTDGVQTAGWSYVYNPAGPSIAFTQVSCCIPPAIVDQMIGLAVRPRPAGSFGPPCAAGSCPVCPMVHGTVGDPNLGNSFFGLSLNGAPAGSIAFAALKIGACSAPGTPIPGLCGPLWFTAPLWGSLGPNFPGGVGCGGNTVFPMALPPIPGLAGLPVASQCLALCPGGGTTMSNCISFVLQGN